MKLWPLKITVTVEVGPTAPAAPTPSQAQHPVPAAPTAALPDPRLNALGGSYL